MKIVTVSSKRQITIPKDLLVGLNLQPRARLILEEENGALMMKPLRKSVVEQTAGSLTPYVSSAKFGLALAKIIKETKRKTAAKLVKQA